MLVSVQPFSPQIAEIFQANELQKGVYIGTSLDFYIWGRNAPYDADYPENLPGDLHCYGVCDNVEQFLSRYGKQFEDDPRKFVLSFHHIEKNPDNYGIGGGWRWHKWGPYIGDGEPTCEYLDDEDEFHDGVYIYHVYHLDASDQNE